MVTRKLSDTDKLDITKLYCRPGETTSTLASKFGVSSSTVSRVLKQVLSEEDYGRVMQWKRSGENGKLDLEFHLPEKSLEITENAAQAENSDGGDCPEHSLNPGDFTEFPPAEPESSSDSPAVDESESESATESTSPLPSKRLSRRRSRSSDEASPPLAQESSPETQLPISFEPSLRLPDDFLEDEESPLTDLHDSERDEMREADLDSAGVAPWIADDLEDVEDFDDDADDDDADYEDDEEDELEDWEENSAQPFTLPTHRAQLEIHPFTSLALEKPCYLVVDRLSELITCPLKDFAELGAIPTGEEHAKTLPIFDNHRIARRFARRNQKVIKLPTGSMLTKTQPHLQAKGIVRVLFDGQIYSIS